MARIRRGGYRIRKPGAKYKYRMYKGVTWPRNQITRVRGTRLSSILPHKFVRYLPDMCISNYEMASSGLPQVSLADTYGALSASPINGFNLGLPTGYGQVNPATNSTYGFGLTYKAMLSSVLDSNDFSNLFDRYRIKGAKVTIIPLQNSFSQYPIATGQSGQSMGTVTIVRDFDDVNLPKDENTLLVKQGSYTRRLSKPISIFVRPRQTALLMDASGVVQPMGIGTNKQWVNMTDKNIPYYGIKMYFNDISLENIPTHPISPDGYAPQLFKIRTKLYFECKDIQ